CSAACVFFQAEDAIRVFHVTGVQTCALPISAGSPVLDPQADGKPSLLRGTAVHRLLQRLPDIAPERRADVALAYLRGAGAGMDRSEERRVGRECRVWGSLGGERSSRAAGPVR